MIHRASGTQRWMSETTIAASSQKTTGRSRIGQNPLVPVLGPSGWAVVGESTTVIERLFLSLAESWWWSTCWVGRGAR